MCIGLYFIDFNKLFPKKRQCRIEKFLWLKNWYTKVIIIPKKSFSCVTSVSSRGSRRSREFQRFRCWVLLFHHALGESVFFNKVAELRPGTLLKRRFWHRCFLGNAVNFLKTLFASKRQHNYLAKLFLI